MTARERLDMIAVKIERAKEHFRSLEREVRIYLESAPYTINTKRAPESRRLIYFLEKVRLPPPKLAATLGDVIHNLRSALDHLAYQLVWIGTGKVPSTRIYFPIADDKAKYIEQRKWQIEGATPNALAKIDALQPYKGGNDTLWMLHRLNNVDKHRVLITAGSAYRSVNIGAHISRKAQELLASSPLGATKLSEMDVGADWPSLNIYLKPADRLFPLKQGDELFMDEPDAEPIEKLQFRFEVAFGEPGVVFGEPILESVASMLAQVEGIPPQFESDLA